MKFDSVIYFPNSQTLVIFPRTFSSQQISFSGQPLSFSNEVLKQLSDHWRMQLEKKRHELSEKGIFSEIKSYSSLQSPGLDALFVNDKPVMWPGSCITLREWKIDEDHVTLFVSETSYPFIAALSDKDFLEKISEENLRVFRPPFAICTFAITSDNFLVLTVRGATTPVYPGRFYGQGGNPQSVNDDLLVHQLEEMEEEILIKSNEVISDSMQFFGIIEDEETFPGKPDLIGTVKISLSSQELKSRFEFRPTDQRPADVADIRLIHFDEESLFQFLRKETEPKDFCPPAHGGLMMIGRNYFGGDWMKKLS